MLCFPQAHQLEVLFRDVTFGHNFSISSLKARGISSVGTGRMESALHSVGIKPFSWRVKKAATSTDECFL